MTEIDNLDLINLPFDKKVVDDYNKLQINPSNINDIISICEYLKCDKLALYRFQF